MRKFMNNVHARYYGIIVRVINYNYNTEMYLVEDRQGYRTSLKEEELRFLTD